MWTGSTIDDGVSLIRPWMQGTHIHVASRLCLVTRAQARSASGEDRLGYVLQDRAGILERLEANAAEFNQLQRLLQAHNLAYVARHFSYHPRHWRFNQPPQHLCFNYSNGISVLVVTPAFLF